MAFESRALTGRMLAERYLVGALLRETDIGTQFRGEDTRTGCAINIDVLRDGLDGESNAARILELDANTSCEIDHPNVVTPRDVGALEDGSPYVITNHRAGETLEDRVCARGAMPLGDAVRIGLDLLSVLAASHELGVTHGDLRPESIFLVQRDGLVLQTLVSGFGRRSGAADQPFGFGDVAFMAPELAKGRPSAVSDLYACGAILYLAATGFPPYSAPLGKDLSDTQQERMLRAPVAFRPELPTSLVRVLVGALQRDASRRYASARDMLNALESVRRGFGSAYAKPGMVPGSRTMTIARRVAANDAYGVGDALPSMTGMIARSNR
jgi:eukaryotic-like serine/threonine-protein kinase